jgi:hypothetical protein
MPSKLIKTLFYRRAASWQPRTSFFAAVLDANAFTARASFAEYHYLRHFTGFIIILNNSSLDFSTLLLHFRA